MPTDPTLVAALRDATVEQLREDAEHAMRIASLFPVVEDGHANRGYRFAALAMAVATMQEKLALGTPGGDLRGVDIGLIGGDDGVTIMHGDRSIASVGDAEFNHNGPTLFAALAALLEAE